MVIPLTVTGRTGTASPVLWALLQKDAGKVSVFEYHGPDVIMRNGTNRVAASFRVAGDARAAIDSYPLGQYIMIITPIIDMKPPTKSNRSGAILSIFQPQRIDITMNMPP